MKADLVKFELRPNTRMIGCLEVKYEKILIKCELVYNTNHKKAWIRMPEVWVNRKQKLQYCYWETKELSDRFQKTLLKQIYDLYNLSLEKVQEIHAKVVAEKNANKAGQGQKNKLL